MKGRGGRGGGAVGEREPLLEGDGKNTEEESGKSVSMARLFAEAKPEAGVLVIATFFLVLASFSSLALFKLAGMMVDACLTAQTDGDNDKARANINGVLVLILAVLLVGGFSGGLRTWLMDSAAERVMCRLRVRLFQSIMRQEVAFFDTNRTGELMNRLSEDTRAMKDSATSSISSALQSGLGAAGALTMMLLTSWQLTAGVLALLPVVIGAFATFARIQKRYSAAQLTSSAAASTVAEESFSAVRTVRSFANEGASCARYRARADEVLGWGLKSAAARGVFGLTFMFAQMGFMVTLWYGARLVLEGNLSLGELNAFLLYAIYTGGSVGSLAAVFSSVVQALGASKRVFQLVDRVPAMPESGQEEPVGAAEGVEVVMEAVCFAYPSRPSTPVLVLNSAHPRSQAPGCGAGCAIPELEPHPPADPVVVTPTRGALRSNGGAGGMADDIAMQSAACAAPIHTPQHSLSTPHTLQDFSLTVAPGQKVALVGSSGGGKSTVVSLLQRFYDPQSGRVVIDGVDLRRISHRHLHAQVALVAQEPVLFAESILYNVSFGLMGRGQEGPVDQRTVEEAARAANAHDFITALPEGYNTLVGERGVRLSGGQRQRLAIARALLIKPRLLLLDEATSALDAESEFLVQQALDFASQGRTCLVVAHRLSTVQNADSVAVVAEGRVAELGSHADLLLQGGLYSSLVRRQLTGESSRGSLGSADASLRSLTTTPE
ncbi:MAG: hypothetical protein WDW36_007089 [Sanguina aurantia]